jgi:hypothetical protein
VAADCHTLMTQGATGARDRRRDGHDPRHGSIPTVQAWFFTPEWLAGEREADQDIAAGRGTVHESGEDMLTLLDPVGSADE